MEIPGKTRKEVEATLNTVIKDIDAITGIILRLEAMHAWDQNSSHRDVIISLLDARQQALIAAVVGMTANVGVSNYSEAAATTAAKTHATIHAAIAAWKLKDYILDGIYCYPITRIFEIIGTTEWGLKNPNHPERIMTSMLDQINARIDEEIPCLCGLYDSHAKTYGLLKSIELIASEDNDITVVITFEDGHDLAFPYRKAMLYYLIPLDDEHDRSWDTHMIKYVLKQVIK